MTRRSRKATQQIVTVALLAFLAQALLPRATWYAHTHAGGGHEHVHGWDGTRVAGSTASLRDFLPHEHDDGDAEHSHDDRPAAATAHRHEADAVAAHEHAHPHETHAATADAGPRRHRTGGPVLAATRGGTHTHGQAPFQVVVAGSVKNFVPPLPHREQATPILASLSDAAAHAPRARGPPPPV